MLAPVADREIVEGDTLSLVASATDPDAGSVVTYALGDAPPGVVISPATGAITWLTSTSLGGATYAIEVQAWDNGSPRLGDALTFNVTVSDINQAPVLDAIAPQSAAAGRALTVQPIARDADLDDTFTYTFAGSVPPGATIDATTGRITWTPGAGDIGSVHEIGVTVTDSGTPPLSDTTTFVVTVQANPDLAREAWLQAHFTSDELADESVSGDLADPNRNARTNLMEYALGAPARAAFDPNDYLRTTVALDPGDGHHHARLVYRERKDDPRLVFYAEVSGDAIAWQGGAAAIEEVGRVSLDDTFDLVTVQDRTPVLPGAPRYARLRVVRN
jgi:hypothetical protein